MSDGASDLVYQLRGSHEVGLESKAGIENGILKLNVQFRSPFEVLWVEGGREMSFKKFVLFEALTLVAEVIESDTFDPPLDLEAEVETS